MTIEFVQLRADVAPRQAQVHVVNGSDTTLRIGEVRVEDPRLAGPATRVVAGRVSTVPPGRSVDVRVQLPAVDCDAPTDGEPEVVLEILSDAGATQARATASDPLGFVAPLHTRECRYERLTDAATLAFTAFRPAAAPEPATLELTVTPTGREQATIVAVEPTNLLELGPGLAGNPYPLDLVVEGGTAPIVVDLPLVPLRCDPHAVQEDKRGTLFDVRVVVDGEPGEIELFVGEELRGRILSWVPVWCGHG